MPSHLVTKLLTLIVVISLPACSGLGNFHQNQLKVISQIVSKNGQYTALIVVSDGGATTAFDYKVLLRNSDSKLPLSRESVIFRSYSDPTPEKIRFTARNTIEIRCDDTSVFAVSFDERTLAPDRKLKFYRGKPWE